MSSTRQVAETGTRSRKQGEHASRPFIAAEVLRTATCIFTASEASSLPVDAITSEVCDVLNDLSNTPTRKAVLRTVARTSGVAYGTLAEAFDTAVEDETATGPVVDVVEALKLRSIDAERLTWAVIAAETMRHHRLVLKESNRMASMWDEWTAEDLIGYAWRGLRLALRSYDPNVALLSTYCVPRIRGAIKDGVRAEGHLPKRLITLRNKVNEAEQVLTEALERRPSLEELAEAVEVDLERIRIMPRLTTPISMESVLDDDDTPREFVATGVSVEDTYETAARSTAISDALAGLDEETAQAVRLLVMDGRSFSQAQLITGVSARQLRTRRDRGLAALAGSLATWAA